MSKEQQQQAQWQTEEEQLRDLTTRAWLVPMLVGSVASIVEYQEPELSQSAHDNRELARHVREDLETWLAYVASTRPDDPFPINLKIALAQGFKQVANWRRRNPSLQAEPLYLAKRAESMLHQVDFWYSRLALLHALTLWSLPDRLGDSSEDHPAQSPDVLVNQWLVMRDAEAERVMKEREAEHPFVAQAAQLCVFALETRQPERFIWIDEAGVVSKTGSGPATTTDSPHRQLWIPPSTGWGALDPRAQQLVADVLILLNLAEGGQAKGPEERERRLAETAKAVLPSCLTGDRSPLDPVQTVGIGGRGAVLRPTCAPDCLIHLCPYPLKGQQPPRAELSEAFCRRQRVILYARGRIGSLRLRLTAPWQGETKSHLKRFWDDMGRRSRQ